jgi:hypothetical protein
MRRFALPCAGVRLAAEKGHCHPFWTLLFALRLHLPLQLPLQFYLLARVLVSSSVRPDNATVISHSIPSLSIQRESGLPRGRSSALNSSVGFPCAVWP